MFFVSRRRLKGLRGKGKNGGENAREKRKERRERDRNKKEVVETCGKPVQGMQIRDSWNEGSRARGWGEEREREKESRGYFGRGRKKTPATFMSTLYSASHSGPVAPILCKSRPRDCTRHILSLFSFLSRFYLPRNL